MDCRFGRSILNQDSISVQYHEPQTNKNGNCVKHFQVLQFEWTAIAVNYTNESRQQSHWNYIHQFESILVTHNSICGIFSMYYNGGNMRHLLLEWTS